MKPHHLGRFSRRHWTLLGALGLSTLTASAQTAPQPAGDQNIIGNAAPTSTTDVFVMSPFEVTETDNKGYQATSTMSGTRLNTKLEDLAASLSVVTKQQILDTAAVDINDVFKYEVNTEGTSQWTNFTVDRGTVTDGVQANPSGSTRMRGLTAANVAVNGFSTALPLDTYNVEAIEISRGPNSTVFGLGATGGGINIIKGKANTTRDTNSFTIRGDTYDGYRGQFDINRVLVRNKAAIRIFGLHDEVGYLRKPSKDTTRRFETTLTLKPTKTTSIYASFESYRNMNSRPNSLTPRDMYTDWASSGKPTWDPTTQIIHFADGHSVGPVSTSTSAEAAQIPFGLSVTDSNFTNSPSAYFNQDGSLGLFMISRMPSSTGIGPTNVSGAARMLQSGNFYIRNSAQFPLYNPLQISDKRLYDWGKVNLAAPNFATTRGESSSVLLEQSILHSQRNTLAFQGAWIYERVTTYDRRFLGTGGASLQPNIDVNEKLLDGTPNPYFLRPYVGGAAPSTSRGRNNNESYRATLAYQLDLTHEKNFLRWLGTNQFMGFAEYRANQGGSMGFQDTAVSNNAWMGTVASRNSTTYRTYPRYYVGDASGNVDYAPARAPSPPYTLPLRYYNGVTAQWITDPTTYDLYYDANRPNKRILSTQGAVWQGFFLDRRIKPLLSIRKDFNRSRDSNSAINPTAAMNGFFDTSPLGTYTTNDWVQQHGKTTSQGVVVQPLKWLGLSYSQSTAFQPGSAIYDVWGLPLPDPYGKTKDYGFQLSLLRNSRNQPRLIITAKQYETVDIGRSTSDLNTIVQRAIRMDRRSSSGDPGLTDWYISQLQTLHTDWDQTRLVAETLQATGADYDYLRSHINKTHGDASNSYSRGKEIEITFNPYDYWTMKLTGSQSIPINGQMSPAVQNYIDARMPTWTTIKDPVSGNNWWTSPEANNTIPRDFFTNNVIAPLKLAIALQGKRRTQTREFHLSYLTKYQLSGITDNRWLKPLYVGTSIRWEDKASIGYLAAAPDADGIVRLYDPNKPVWQKGNTYVDFLSGYRFKMWHNRVNCLIQLNVQNVFESGHLQTVAVNPDGVPWAFRIIDPRKAILTVRFDL